MSDLATLMQGFEQQVRLLPLPNQLLKQQVAPKPGRGARSWGCPRPGGHTMGDQASPGGGGERVHLGGGDRAPLGGEALPCG